MAIITAISTVVNFIWFVHGLDTGDRVLTWVGAVGTVVGVVALVMM
jgi:hypothetical protein